MFFCKSPRIPSLDSLEYTFLACSVAEDFFHEMMMWFNNEQAEFKMTKQQILFNYFTPYHRITTSTELEIRNFHNTNDKVYLRL